MDLKNHPSMRTEEYLRILLIRCGQKLGNSGSRQTQGRVLKILYLQGSMPQKVIQDKLNIQPGSMSEITAKLERRGLIRREKDEEDKRKMFLSLTDAGRIDVENFLSQDNPPDGRRFAALTENEKQTLCTLLEKLMISWE